jgi:hypothetical protein
VDNGRQGGFELLLCVIGSVDGSVDDTVDRRFRRRSVETTSATPTTMTR